MLDAGGAQTGEPVRLVVALPGAEFLLGKLVAAAGFLEGDLCGALRRPPPSRGGPPNVLVLRKAIADPLDLWGCLGTDLPGPRRGYSGAILERNEGGFGLEIAKNRAPGPVRLAKVPLSKPLTGITFCNCDSTRPINLPSIKRKARSSPTHSRSKKPLFLSYLPISTRLRNVP